MTQVHRDLARILRPLVTFVEQIYYGYTEMEALATYFDMDS
jgi:hypothetical protein